MSTGHPHPIGRRRFLRRVASGLVVAGFPTILPARLLGASAPSNLLQIGVIGCGRIARDMDLPGVLRHPDRARVVAVADVDARRARWAREQVVGSYRKSVGQEVGVTVLGDYREMLGRADVDAVMVCTPDHWHSQPVVEAALAGKDIYVQKPLSLTVAEGRLVSDVVRARGRILQIGSQQRSTVQFHRACELVRNGALGRVRSVKVGLPTDPPGGRATPMPVPEGLDYEAWLGCAPEAPYTEDRVHPRSDDPRRAFGRPGWLRLNAHTCGMITGWGSHHLDIVHWALGTEFAGPVAVEARAEWPGPDSFWNVHGHYEVRLEYPGGIGVTVGDGLPNGVRFEGERGWIWVTRGRADAPQSFAVSDPDILRDAGDEPPVRLHRSPRWDHHLDWLEAVAARREAVTQVETGHRSCSACLISWIGMRLGRRLTWDPGREQFDDPEANALRDRPERGPHGAFRAAAAAGFREFRSLREKSA